MSTPRPQTQSSGQALRLFHLAATGAWRLNLFGTCKNSKASGFWENAKPSKQTNASRLKWMTFGDHQLDGVQHGIKVHGVFCWYPSPVRLILCVYESTAAELLPRIALKNITAGFMAGAAALVCAAVTSKIFASITGLEYAFTKAPNKMSSLVSVFLFMSALSSAIGETFVSLSADPLLVWNYGVMGVLAGLIGSEKSDMNLN